MVRSRSLLAAWMVAAAVELAAPGVDASDVERVVHHESTADHGKFEALKGPFRSAPEVTAACLSCHTEAAKQVQRTVHWTWEFKHPATGQLLGKRHIVNSFCGGITSNEPRCTSCHAGYGWRDSGFDFSDETKVDCLVCHDGTGTYQKFPTAAGHPLYEPATFEGKDWQPPDLVTVAQSVGPPARRNCGACHFYGGGGDGAKHGDLDSSLAMPAHALDVHMDANGLNFACQQCHVAGGHRLAGSRYAMAARDTEATGKPGLRRDVASCESCHGLDPHGSASLISLLLNAHIDKVACQTCHIPAFARGGRATKTFWDRSTAGRLDEKGKPIKEKDAEGYVSYLSTEGTFVWEKDVIPTYRWFDGQMRYTLVGDKINGADPVKINYFHGNHDDPNARIWPFKIMRGRQPYDQVNKTLVYTHVFGKDDTAFSRNFDWPSAIATAMKAAGQTFSGEYGFVETVMYWPITHMVAPKDKALACKDCHNRHGRLAELTGFYLPGRDRNRLLDVVATTALALAVFGVIGHAGLRIIFRLRARR